MLNIRYFTLFLVALSTLPSLAESRRTTILPDQSQTTVSAVLSLFGNDIVAAEQFPNSLVSSFDGNMDATASGSISEVMLGTSSQATGIQTRNVRPEPHGEDGVAPGSYGAKVTVSSPLFAAPFDIPGIGQIDPGTILPGTFAEAALRSVKIIPSTKAGVLVHGGKFDAAMVNLAVTSEVALRSIVLLKANSLPDYIKNLAALEILDATSDVIDDVKGSCPDIPIFCSSRTITVTVGHSYPISAMPENKAASEAEIVSSRNLLQFSIPTDFVESKVVLENVLSFELHGVGKLVASVKGGDMNANGRLDADDIDAISLESRVESPNTLFGLDGNATVDEVDRLIWVKELAQTNFGDADLDGAVEFDDFLALSSHFGEPSGWSGGDFSGDSGVAFDDFLLLSANYSTATRTAALVPEPYTMASFWTSVVILIARRRLSHPIRTLRARYG